MYATKIVYFTEDNIKSSRISEINPLDLEQIG